MSFFVQHGFGKSDKIRHLHSLGLLGGAVLSPADELPDSMLRTVAELLQSETPVLIDPQMYIHSSARETSARRHKENQLEFPGLHWSQSSRSTESHLQTVKDLNERLDVPLPWISPAPMQFGFEDAWTSLSLQFARTAVEIWGGTNTIASVVIDERSLNDLSALNQWLDVATTLPVRGFYLLVERSATNYPPAPWNVDQLSNLLTLTYVLGELNDYELIWGYSDLEGVLALAAGASSMAAGWSHGLRQFSTGKWVARSGGTQPPSRVPIPVLMCAPEAETEAVAIARSRTMSDVSPDDYFHKEVPAGRPVALAEYQKSYMEWLAMEAITVTSHPRRHRREYWHGRLEEALSRLTGIQRDGVLMNPSYVGRVRNQLLALNQFRTRERA